MRLLSGRGLGGEGEERGYVECAPAGPDSGGEQATYGADAGVSGVIGAGVMGAGVIAAGVIAAGAGVSGLGSGRREGEGRGACLYTCATLTEIKAGMDLIGVHADAAAWT